ncbi:MAG: amylo-alpha-1,6-glucosidase [Acidobacteria bacterium]|nr:MAG: amylo-alpha-1,6-glucosidase [Acidobacteriota bacterium]
MDRARCFLIFLTLASAMGFTSETLASPPRGIKRFPIERRGLQLSRPAHPFAPLDVTGRRAALLGREDGRCEAWVYPLKILSDFRWTFELGGDSSERQRIPAQKLATTVTVRPECTILTFSHAAFTAREIMFAPLDQPAVVILLDVDAQRPLRLIGSFRRELKLMWPAETAPSRMRFDARTSAFLLTDAEEQFAALIGIPGAEEISLTDEQKGQPRRAQFALDVSAFARQDEFAPILIVGAPTGGLEAARRTYADLLASLPQAYQRTLAHYRRLKEETVQISTGDERLDRAFEWAKVRVDKGYVENPFLGAGLVAGFRQSGETLRPGFAWFFGRDALWTTLAITSTGDWDLARTVLRFLKKHQRADGKIMHELSQAASFVDWAGAFPYYYAAADATPLYLIALDDYYRASGDVAFLKEMWTSAQRAYQFVVSTDSDGNGLIENTAAGHGWVEGGRLLPVHEEIYLQGLWMQAGRAMAHLAEAMGEGRLATICRQRAERARATVERLFWNEDRGFYAFGRRRRGTNFNGARTTTLPEESMIMEVTVMPAVPMWWGWLDERRAARMLEHIASAALATDWGARLLSNRSALYDPLSYHYGSVWPLFTGWAAMACYRYRRPLAGYELLMSNAQLTYDEALGAHTELLSGDRYRSFDFSSFDQVWSSAMIITPLIRGLLGLEWDAPARQLVFAPQWPAQWDEVIVRNLRLGEARLDLQMRRRAHRVTLDVTRRGGRIPLMLDFRPAFPLDAGVKGARVNGHSVPLEIDRGREDQMARLRVQFVQTAHIDIDCTPGTELIVPFTPARLGERTRRLKILRTSQNASTLEVDVEGRMGAIYEMIVSTPRDLREVVGAEIATRDDHEIHLRVRFAGPSSYQYARKTIALHFAQPAPGRSKTH